MSYNRRFAVALATIALPLLGVTSAARAQQQLTDDGQHLFRVGAAGGVVVPTANTRTALKQGVQAQAFVLVNLLRGVPLRFNLGYQKFELKQALGAATMPGTAADTGSTQILAGVAGTQIDLLHGPVRPYVTLGLGGFDVRGLMTAAAGSPATSVSQLKFGIDGGAGLAIRIGRLDGFVEGHLQNVYTDRGLIDARSIQAVPVSFGVLF